ncbi:9785_t:CDS:2, partial [Paraglomus occultum]
LDNDVESASTSESAKTSSEAAAKLSNKEGTSTQPTQKDDTNRSKPSLRDIQAEEERKKQQEEKDRANAQHSILSTPPGKPLSPQKSTNIKTPSLREIQEAEARKAAERKAAERQTINAVNAAAGASSRENVTLSSTSWGLIMSNTAMATNSASSSSNPPAVSTQAWQSAAAPKKTLREIQKEEEEAVKRRNKMREMQQQAMLNVAASSPTSSGVGKRYADTLVTGPNAVNAKAKTTTIPTGMAWTTVAGKPATRIVMSSAAGGNGGGTVMKSAGSKDLPLAWDEGQKGTNGLQNAYRQLPTKSTDQTKSVTRSMSLNATTSGSKQTNNNYNNSSLTNSDQSPPRPPSEDFMKWCRQALRGLTNINSDEFIQMLLTFPLDPPPATIEIIQDSIYTYSPTLDGRRFADEFVKRRKADASGIPMSNFSIHHADSKTGKDVGTGTTGTKDDNSGTGAGAFKVVTTKKNKKRH